LLKNLGKVLNSDLPWKDGVPFGKEQPVVNADPFMKSNLTRLKLVLPVSKTRVWQLVGTPKGLASWFPTHVKGRIAAGKMIEFGWTTGTEKHRVLHVRKGES